MSSGTPYLYLSPPANVPIQIPVEVRPCRPPSPPPHVHACFGPPVWVRSDGTRTEWSYNNGGGHHFCAQEARNEAGRVVTTHETCGPTNLAVRYDETRDGRQQTWVINQFERGGCIPALGEDPSAPRPLPRPAPPEPKCAAEALFPWCSSRTKSAQAAQAIVERDAALARYEDAKRRYDDLVRAIDRKRNGAEWTKHISEMERAYAEGVRAAHLAHLPHHCVFHPVHYAFDPCHFWPIHPR